MIRFVEANEAASSIMNAVIDEYFPELKDATIKILFDTKKRTYGDKIVLGRISSANDLVRRLTDDEAEEGCDYVMFLDKIAFEAIPESDRIRLIRHELRHCRVSVGSESIKYGIIPHDIEDFAQEVKLNVDEVDWAKRAVALAADIYAQMEEDEKEKKQTRKLNRRNV
jgi:predicted metallopeptidase